MPLTTGSDVNSQVVRMTGVGAPSWGGAVLRGQDSPARVELASLCRVEADEPTFPLVPSPPRTLPGTFALEGGKGHRGLL